MAPAVEGARALHALSLRDFTLGAGRAEHCRGSSAASLLSDPAPRVYIWIMLDWTRCDAVERASDKLSGAWTFKGTRVPVKALFANLEDGATVAQFLEWFRA